jgi:hypothetical protein
MSLISVTFLLLSGSRPLNAISVAVCADVVEPCFVVLWFNLYAVFCGLSSVLDTITWSLANDSFKSC